MSFIPHHLAGHWHLCTWAPHCYRIPPDQPLPDLCEAFLNIGQSAQPTLPPDLITRFQLTEIEYDEFDRLWRRNK